VLELWDLVPSQLHASGPPRHDVLSTASDMARHTSEHRRSVAHARAALEQAEQADASPAVIATLLRRLSYLSWLGGDADEGAEILGRALAAAGDEPTIELAQVLGWRSRFLVLSNRAQEAIDPGERAVALARQLGAPREEGYALNSLAVAHALLDDLDRGLPMLREARRLALASDAIEDVGVAYNNEITLLLMAGRHTEAVAVTSDARDWAHEAGIRGGVVVSITLNGVDGLVTLGRYHEAEQLLAVTPVPHEDPISRYEHRLQSAMVHLARGDLETARAHATEAHEIVAGRSDLQLLSMSAAALGYLDRLQARHEDGLSRIEVALQSDSGWATSAEPHRGVRVHALLAAERARVARDHGDQPTVEETLFRLDQLLERARERAAHEPHGYARHSLEQAMLQAVAERGWITGEPDADAWRDARAAFPDGSPVFDVLVAEGRLAEALIATGERDEASAVVASTLARAVEVGARQLETELTGLAHRFRLPVQGESAGTDGTIDAFGLTAREQEVLRLLADGSTNRQIGETLYISTKTASVHVSNILGKLGVDNRGEAAAVAHRAGLTSDPVRQSGVDADGQL
jgi:DNA-binding CsgD family transcriptional regulator/tetratricopeptide (TPR) repeat protein